MTNNSDESLREVNRYKTQVPYHFLMRDITLSLRKAIMSMTHNDYDNMPAMVVAKSGMLNR